MDRSVAFIASTAPFCFIHSSSCDQDIHTNLTSPRDLQSWSTLLEAANVHKFKPLLDLCTKVGDGVIPPVFYHSYCRNTFVYSLKKPCSVALDRDFNEGNIQNTEAQMFQHSVEPAVKYHLQSSRSCQLAPSNLTESSCFEDPSSAAFKFVVQHIRDRLSLSKEILLLEDIAALYTSKLAEYEQTDSDRCESAATLNLQSKLQQKFGNSLLFSTVGIYGPTFMYPDSLTFGDLLKWISKLLKDNVELKEKLTNCQHTVVDACTQTEDQADGNDNDAADVLFGEMEHSETFHEMINNQLPTEKESCNFSATATYIQQDIEQLKITTDESFHRQCVCHVKDIEDESIRPFKQESWELVCKYVRSWKDLDGIFKTVAVGFDTTTAVTQGYHTSCYKRFTDYRMIVVAYKRLLDLGEQIKGKDGSSSETAKDVQSAGMITEVRHMNQFQCRTGECIFCHVWKRDKGYGDKKDANLYHWGSHNPTSTMLAKIRQAAEQRQDDELLQLLRRVDVEPDFVLKGHKGCYYAYIRQSDPARKPCRPIKRIEEFEQLCTDVVDKRIIEGGEMVTRHELVKMFIKSAEVSHRVFVNWNIMLTRRLKVRYRDNVRFVHVYGQNSYFLVSKTRLQQILTNADSEQQNEAGNDVWLEQSTTGGIQDLHSSEVTMDAPYRCIACRKLFESCTELDSHRSENSSCSARYVELIRCAAEFGVDLNSITHVPNLQRYKCQTCLRCYNTEGLLQQHAKRDHKTETVLHLYTCKVCSKWFRQAEQYDQHMEKAHSNTTFTFHRCKFCDKEFSRITDLREHMRSCGNSEPNLYICQYCSKQFGRPSILQKHMLHLHLKRGVKCFVCEHCNQLFRSSRYWAFVQHLKSHSSEQVAKPFCCEICGKLFQDSYKLKVHMEFHADVKSYLCEFCSKLFRSITKLKQHTALHHCETRSYICQDCGKGFIQPSYLKYHAISHSGLKPFVCSTCGKAFGTKKLLRQHTRSHTKPYCCVECCKRFAHKWSLKLHTRTHQEVMTQFCRLIVDKTEKDDITHCDVDETENLSVPVMFYADSDTDTINVCGEIELPFSTFDVVVDEDFMK